VRHERIKIVDDLKQKSDAERELIQQLLAIGAAPYLVTQAGYVKCSHTRSTRLLQDQIRAEEDELNRRAKKPGRMK
jgi:hypothetical protein